MRVEWKVDPVVNRMLWEELSLLPVEHIGKSNPEVVLDLGGGSGDFASPLMGTKGTTVIVLDNSLDALEDRIGGTQAILGDATSLPFKDSTIDAVTARAILHHFPESLDQSLAEVRRALKKDGLLLVQEPLMHNCFARLARRYVSTERHEEGEEPLDPVVLAKSIGNQFKVDWREHHFLFSYLLPHLTHRAPGAFKSLARRISALTKNLDEKILSSMPKTRRYSAYMSILGRKSE